MPPKAAAKKRLRSGSVTTKGVLSPYPHPDYLRKPDNFDEDDLDLAVSDRTAVQPLTPQLAGLSLDTLGGIDPVVRALTESVHLSVSGTAFYSDFRVKRSSHTLIYGPSGLGKTTIGHGLKTFCSTYPGYRVAFYKAKVYEDQKSISALFESAKFLQPSVIFIDQVNCLCSTASEAASLAQELDDLADHDGVIVIGTAVQLIQVDHTLMTPWRFSTYLPLTVPLQEARLQILKKLTAGWSGVTEGMRTTIQARTDNWTGAELSWLCRTAAEGSMKRTHPHLLLPGADFSAGGIVQLTMGDFENAFALRV